MTRAVLETMSELSAVPTARTREDGEESSWRRERHSTHALGRVMKIPIIM